MLEPQPSAPSLCSFTVVPVTDYFTVSSIYLSSASTSVTRVLWKLLWLQLSCSTSPKCPSTVSSVETAYMTPPTTTLHNYEFEWWRCSTLLYFQLWHPTLLSPVETTQPYWQHLLHNVSHNTCILYSRTTKQHTYNCLLTYYMANYTTTHVATWQQLPIAAWPSWHSTTLRFTLLLYYFQPWPPSPDAYGVETASAQWLWHGAEHPACDILLHSSPQHYKTHTLRGHAKSLQSHCSTIVAYLSR